MKVQILAHWPEIIALRDCWNELAAGVPTRSWEWLTAWWQTFGGRHALRVLVARDHGGEPLGIAPFYLQQRGILPILRFLGSGKVCSDYAAILARPDATAEVCEAIAETLTASPGREGRRLAQASIELDGVQPADPWLAKWSDALARRKYTSRARQLESCWRVALPSKLETLPQQLASQARRKLRKALARFDTGEVDFKVGSPASVLADLEQLEHLHTLRHQAKGEAGCFADKRFGQFLRIALPAMVATGQAEFVHCSQAGQPLATQLLLRGAGGQWMYQSGLDPQFQHLEPGHLVIAGSLRAAVLSGASFFDFMRGDEPYKATWSAKPTPLQRISYIPHARLPQLADATYSWLRELRNRSRQRTRPVATEQENRALTTAADD
jgi:CelD/BcsL family acetyltransferase involved in cellulose biosynthesis